MPKDVLPLAEARKMDLEMAVIMQVLIKTISWKSLDIDFDHFKVKTQDYGSNNFFSVIYLI